MDNRRIRLTLGLELELGLILEIDRKDLYSQLKDLRSDLADRIRLQGVNCQTQGAHTADEDWVVTTDEVRSLFPRESCANFLLVDYSHLAQFSRQSR